MHRKLSASNIALSIIGITFVFVFPHLGLIPIPFAYTVPVLLVVWFLLKRTNEKFSNLGFSFKRFEWKAVWIGAVAAVILFVFLNYLFFPLLSEVVYLSKANLDDFKNIRHNPGNYVFILLMGWIVGGWYEELVFHGYIFTRIEKIIAEKCATVISFFLANLIFGFYHLQLGLSGILNAFLAGCAYKALMLQFKRNLWYSIFFHGFFDTIGLTFIYLGYW
jgi:membrane protease YdiL (CAAX protease family)